MGLFDWLAGNREASKYTDEEILRIYRSKDLSRIRSMENDLFRSAFTYIIHSKKAISALPDPDERRQVYNDAFFDFAREMRKGNFREESSLKTFFTSIFNHKVLDLLKHKQTNTYKANQPSATEMESRLELLSQQSRDILKDLLTKEKLEQVKALLKPLYAGKTPCLELLMMAAEGLKQAEMAKHLGLTTGSVKTKVSDCRKQLLAKL